MTFAKATALALAFAGAVALGVWIGPHMTHRDRTATDTTASADQTSTSSDQTAPQRAPATRANTKASRKAAAATTPTKTSSLPRPVGSTPPTVPAAAPALHERLKPLLNKGADMGIAAQDFDSAEKFAAVAHAARNTDVPFMLLKHRTVEEGKSLEQAIRELKPEVNATAEGRRAREQAKADISALTTG
jgi:hypothetical protein